MRKFEKGKWYEYMWSSDHPTLIKGKAYECVDVDESNGILTVRNDDGLELDWYQKHFNPVPVEPHLRFEKGKWYTRVKNTNEGRFTVGKAYECVENNGEDWFYTISDNGTTLLALGKNFNPVPVEPTPQFKRGEMVEVMSNKSNPPYTRIYLETIEGAKSPIVCVAEGDEDKFRNGKLFEFTLWKHARPISTTITMKEAEAIVSEKLGKLVKIEG